MKKNVLISSICALMSLSSPAWTEIKFINIHVDGFFCDICAVPTVSRVRSVESVESAEMWLENGVIHVTLKPNATFDPQEFIKVLDKSSFVYQSMDVQVEGRLSGKGDTMTLEAPENKTTFYLEPSDNLSHKGLEEIQQAASKGKTLTLLGSCTQDNDKIKLSVDKVIP